MDEIPGEFDHHNNGNNVLARSSAGSQTNPDHLDSTRLFADG